MRRCISPLVVIAGMAAAFASPPVGQARGAAVQQVLELDGDVSGVHDPSVIKEANTYYVFCTGGRPGPRLRLRAARRR